MKNEITSFSTNTSSAFSFSTKHEIALSWNSMPSFPAAAPEMELGWDAMPAFGTAAADQGNAEIAADFVMEARSMRPAAKANVLSNFWSAVCR